jgi:hypothetical protein
MNFLMNRFGLGLGFGFKRTTTTTIVSTVVTAILAYKSYKAYKAYKARPRINEPSSPPVFENKYFKEYDEMEDDPHAPVPLPHNHVRETTPQGDVIMTYDVDQSVFCYYCDKRSVQFKYLEPVARKYVLAHGCKRLYIDFRKQLTKAKSATPAPAPAPAPVTNPASIFAQFKKYTPALKSKGRGANEERACVVKEHVTRYLYCGRLDEFKRDDATATTPTEDPQHDFSIIKPMDYASYKKMTDS